MATAGSVDAVRTAGGKRNGKLSGWHPADLAGEVLKARVERNASSDRNSDMLHGTGYTFASMRSTDRR